MDTVYAWTPWIIAFSCASMACFVWVIPAQLKGLTDLSQRPLRRRQFYHSALFAALCAFMVPMALTPIPYPGGWDGLFVFIPSGMIALVSTYGWIQVVKQIVGWARRRSQIGATDI